jgi:hypothetical protein
MFLKTNEYEILRNFGIAPQGSHRNKKKSRNIDKTKSLFPPINIANSSNILTDSKRALKELSSKCICFEKETNLNFT